MIRLTILGSGTLQPTPERGCSGYFLNIEDQNVLLDAGSGVLRQLSRINIQACDIDHVFFTHFHIDHTADLVPLLLAKRYTSDEKGRDISIYGPPGFKDYYKQLSSIYRSSFHSDSYGIFINEYGEAKHIFSGFSATFIPVDHAENSYGFRFEDKEGVQFAYSGDTDYCDNLVSLCKDCDVAVIECSYPAGKKITGHMTPAEVGKAANRAQCKKVVMTHLYPDTQKEDILSACALNFKGKISVAEELKTIFIE